MCGIYFNISAFRYGCFPDKTTASIKESEMIGYITVRTNDLEKAVAFYDALHSTG